MDKTRAARTSVVAAFLSAGGTLAATAPAEAAPPPQPTVVATAAQVQLGDPLVRFLKLDGFPAYLKADGFGQYSKFNETILPELAALYLKNGEQVDGLLALYHKVNAGPLGGI